MAEQQIEIVATEISEIEAIEAAPMSEIEAVEISEIEAIEAIEMSEIEAVEISEIEIAEMSDPEPSNDSRQSIEHFEVLSSRQIPGPGNNILRHGNSLIPEVRSIVSSNDDPDLESMTIRTWIIGPIVCATMATVRARVLFDHKSLDIPVDFILFSILLVGNLMAAKLANRIVRVPLIGFEFSLNPGGFNSKENFLTCAFAYIGMARPNMLQTIAVLRNHFGEQVYPSAAYFAVLSSYLLGYLLVGLFLNWVLSPAMWWPSKLLDVVFFRTWHREYDGSMGSITNRKFFIIFFVVSIIYHIPAFLYPPIATLSFLCWRWKKSTTAQQIGSGVNGLGLFSFSIDWSSLSDFMGDPLSTPRPVIYNVMGGFFITFFVLIPSIYWTNAYQTKRFPLFSASMYDASGNIYNITRVLNHDGVTINEQAYKDYSLVFWSAFALISYCLKFASIPTGFIHVLVYYGRGMWEVVNEDEHNEMMRQYQPLRRFWFFVVSAIAFCLACASCAMGLGPNIKFPFLLILAAIAVALLIFTPMGIFVATTSQVLPGYLICRLLGGYLYANKPFQFLIFNDYANQSATNAILFLGTLKLGHYMKVNPRNTFIVLVAASIISASVGFGVSWQLGTGHAEKPGGSPLDMVYQMAITWSVIGPRRLFNDGNYAKLILSFVAIFAIAELILLIASRKWKLIKEIKLPVILATTVGMPPAVPANLNSWFFVGLVFPVVASHFKASWSPNYQYLLAVSLTTGVGVLSALGYLMTKVIPTWGSQSKDYCPLAKCPTAPGMRVDDCE